MELERYVQEKCPPADSSLIAEAGASATSSSCEAVPEPLNRGEVSQLTKHVRDVIIEACRGGKLLEPFAKKVLGANATAREMRCWKDKAVVAVFYKVSWAVRDSITLVGRSLGRRHKDAAAKLVLEPAGDQEPVAESIEAPTSNKAVVVPETAEGDDVVRTPVKAKSRAPAGSGRKRELAANIVRQICAHCQDEGAVHELMHNLENRLQEQFPGINFHNNLATLPQTSTWFLGTLGRA